MQHKPFILKSHLGHRIYGILNLPAKKPRGVVVLVHGLTGHMHEYYQIVAAQYFAHSGYAVVRFNQYHDQQGALRFDETTISLHVNDTKKVLAWIAGKFNLPIALIGHSLGAVVAIAAAARNVTSLVLWDPTSTPSERVKDWAVSDKKLHCDCLAWQLKIVLGKQWVEDAKEFPDAYETLSSLTLPTLVLRASAGGMKDYAQRYYAAVKGRRKLVQLKSTDHCFTNPGAIEQVLKHTGKWLDRYLCQTLGC